jgi:hypothetical protein
VNSYTPGTVMVFLNGSKLPSSSYTASSGSSVVLTDAALATDVIEVLSWLMSGVQNAAPLVHQHSTADLTGPALPVALGGTGLTSLSALPISTAQQAALDLKADKSQLATSAVQRFSVADGNLTAGQTTITVNSYTPGTVMVFINGSKVPANAYTATSGTTVVLVDPVQAPDVVEILSWQMNGVQNAAPISHQHSTADLTGPALSVALGGLGNGTGNVSALTVTPNGDSAPKSLAALMGELALDVCRLGLNPNGPNYAFTNADLISQAIDTAVASGRPIAFTQPGTYYVSYVSKSISRSIEIHCADGVTIKGLGTKSEFSCDGATTVFTVTDSWVAFIDQGYNVQTYNPATKTYSLTLVESTDFTRAGATFTLATPPASGLLLRITSQKDVISFTGPGAIPGSIGAKWVGGTFDLSLRGLGYNINSGAALSFNNMRQVHVDRVYFKARGSQWDAYENGFADTGLGGSFHRGEITNCTFEGFGDCGIYITGRNETESFYKYGNLTITGCHFWRCLTGFAAKRRMDQITTIGNSFEECGVGLAYWPAGGNGGGTTGTMTGNTFTRCTVPIDIRNVRGVTVSGNNIIDWGYDNQTGLSTANTPALKLLGVQDSTFANNTLVFRDWAKDTQIGYQFAGYTFETTTMQIVGNAISGGKICDCATAFTFDAAATGCSISGINLTNVASIISDASGTTLWRVVNAGAETWGKGNTNYVGTWTPTLALSGMTFTGTYITQQASYIRVGDEVTVHFKVQCNAFTFTGGTSSNELRITGLPFSPAATNVAYHGSLGISSGITWPAGTVGTSLEIFASGTTVHLTSIGSTSTRSINATDIASGATVRVDGTLTYRAV